MKIELHQKAIDNYNEKAEKLLTELTPDPHPKRESQGLPTIFTHKIPSDDIHNFTKQGYVDFYGEDIARVFKHGEAHIGLFDESYKSLIKLAEGMQKAGPLRNTVSLSLLSNLIFEWLTEKYKSSTDVPMTEYVLRECEKRISDIEI